MENYQNILTPEQDQELEAILTRQDIDVILLTLLTARVKLCLDDSEGRRAKKTLARIERIFESIEEGEGKWKLVKMES